MIKRGIGANTHVSNSINGNYNSIKNFFITVLGNFEISEFITVLLYLLSCFSCLFEVIRISFLEVCCDFASHNYSLTVISDLPFFGIALFGLFVLSYSIKYGSLKYKAISVLFLITALIMLTIFKDKPLILEQAIIVSISAMTIPVFLLFLVSNIKKKYKEDNYT